MKKKINIPLIAFIIAIAALIFSVATLIKCIIQNQNIFIAILGVVGTALILGVCAITLYLNKAYSEENEDEENDESQKELSEDSEEDHDSKKDDDLEEDNESEDDNNKDDDTPEDEEEVEELNIDALKIDNEKNDK